ncbi:DNA polymerase III subunit beta [Rhizobium grahamii]|uniref:Beta sliding clamp n=1 Tax=Rhizobium grahamii CCGE 502 TaxID=990285 RepID=S3HLL3_9HYPH|nr:DNA polymerase III subunit beta [Rhizobium grahamii]EPE99504.1 DNA polymerase III subunit beta [Rhizobium grahamii CCGE 502]
MFITEKASIAAALSVAKDAVDGKAKIPVLTHVLFDREGDRLSITGTNLDQEIRSTFSAEIGRDFEPFACPAQMLVDIVKNVADGFNITVEAGRTAGKISDIRIRSGAFRTKLPVLPASDFPVMPSGNLPHQLSLSAVNFLKALKAVSFAVETNEQRYAYCGVRLDAEADGLMVCASNGNRLAKRFLSSIEFDQDLYGVPSVTVPNAAIPAIVKILDKKEDVTIDLSEDKIRVASDEAVLTSKLVDGDFVPYKALSPSKNGVRATFSAQALATALARVLTISSDKMSGVAFDFQPGRLVLQSSSDAVGGEASDEIQIQCDGEIRQGYNGRYVIAALEHLDRDEVEIIVGEGRNPAFLSTAGDPNTVMMVGVMRITGASSVTAHESEAA